jgi:hypothetical protein
LLLLGCGRTGGLEADALNVPADAATAATVDGAPSEAGPCQVFVLTPPVPYAVAGGLGNLVPGDFTGDGWIDLLVDEGQGTGELFTNTGAGAFSRSSLQASSANNYANAVAGDFDHDGTLDLASQADGGLGIDFGLGGGALRSTLATTTTPYQEGNLLQGDFNGDVRPDLVFAGATMGPLRYGGLPTPTVSDFGLAVFLNAGGGSFLSPATYDRASIGNAMAAGDFDGDGHLDLAAAVGDGLTVYLNTGDGTFQDALRVPVGAYGAYGLAVADFNADGLDDLATFTSTDGDAGLPFALEVFTSRGGGAFNAPTVDALVSPPPLPEIAKGDFNGDGLPDLAMGFDGPRAGGAVSAPIAVFLNQGGATFGGAVTYETRTDGLPFIQTFVAADFNGDGATDLAVAAVNEDFESPEEVVVLLSKCAQR